MELWITVSEEASVAERLLYEVFRLSRCLPLATSVSEVLAFSSIVDVTKPDLQNVGVQSGDDNVVGVCKCAEMM